MDLDRLVADAKDLCYRVAAAELSGSPLWIVPQTNLPPMLGANTVCYGYTSPSLDMHLHHTFSDWEGTRGPVIVLGNLNIQRDFPQRTYNKMLGTTLHELAHILERPSLFRPRPYNHFYKVEADTLCAATFRQICSMAPPPHFKAIYEADQRDWFNSAPQRRRKKDEFDIAT